MSHNQISDEELAVRAARESLMRAVQQAVRIARGGATPNFVSIGEAVDAFAACVRREVAHV